MASKTGEDMVIDAKKLCLTFDANDGPVHALKDVDLGIEKGAMSFRRRPCWPGGQSSAMSGCRWKSWG